MTSGSTGGGCQGLLVETTFLAEHVLWCKGRFFKSISGVKTFWCNKRLLVQHKACGVAGF